MGKRTGAVALRVLPSPCRPPQARRTSYSRQASLLVSCLARSPRATVFGMRAEFRYLGDPGSKPQSCQGNVLFGHRSVSCRSGREFSCSPGCFSGFRYTHRTLGGFPLCCEIHPWSESHDELLSCFFGIPFGGSILVLPDFLVKLFLGWLFLRANDRLSYCCLIYAYWRRGEGHRSDGRFVPLRRKAGQA